MRRYAELRGGAEFDRCSILLCGGQLAGSAELWCRVLLVAGPLLRVEACVRGNAGGAVVWNPLERGVMPSCCDCVLHNEVPKF